MATPADQRLLELLDKWLTSLELHAKYSTLDEPSYRNIQPWPEHQRPVRWIIDLARQKALALQSQVQERVRMGDASFADSLELMIFLANLVGSEHIQRFIPLAYPENERVPAPDTAQPSPAAPPGLAVPTADSQSEPKAEPKAAPQTAPRPPPVVPSVAPRPASVLNGAQSASTTGTREMPTFTGLPPREPAAAGTPTVARTERRPALPPPAPAAAELMPPDPERRSAAADRRQAAVDAKTAADAKTGADARVVAVVNKAVEPAAPARKPLFAERRTAEPDRRTTAAERKVVDISPAPAGRGGPPDRMREQVIADAARLVQWGRRWYELAEIIAGMADRPHLTDVRRILKDNKSVIEKKAGRS